MEHAVPERAQHSRKNFQHIGGINILYNKRRKTGVNKHNNEVKNKMDYEYHPVMETMAPNTAPGMMPKATPNFMQREEIMHPEVYRKMHPHVLNIIQEIESKYGNVYVTEDFLNRMCDELIKRSEFNSDDQMTDSVETMAPYYGRGRNWRHFHHDALRDIGRILFLNEIFGRRRYRWR